MLQKGDFDKMVTEMVYLHKHFKFKIFGGCCGTNDVFLEKLSRNLIK